MKFEQRRWNKPKRCVGWCFFFNNTFQYSNIHHPFVEQVKITKEEKNVALKKRNLLLSNSPNNQVWATLRIQTTEHSEKIIFISYSTHCLSKTNYKNRLHFQVHIYSIKQRAWWEMKHTQRNQEHSVRVCVCVSVWTVKALIVHITNHMFQLLLKQNEQGNVQKISVLGAAGF